MNFVSQALLAFYQPTVTDRREEIIYAVGI
jgi:hypothetical protein